MEKIISLCQLAFTKGQMIQKNVIITHEILHSMKGNKGKEGWLTIKCDIEKHFD